MKYFLLSLVFCSVYFNADAQSGSYQNDFKLVRTAIATYLLTTAENAYNFAPAGVNASTGCLNEKMNCRHMDRLADPLDEFKFYSNLGSGFYEEFYTFSLANQQAFRQCANHVCTYMHPQHILYPCTSCNINHLLDISNHMLRLFLSPKDTDPMLEKVRDNVLKMYETVNHSNNSSQDCNANGWITWQVHNAARAGLDHLNLVNVNNRTSTAGKLGMVMSHFYKDIIALPVQDFDTWLSPEWQVGYYTIMYSTYLELTTMDFTPNSTSYLDYAASRN